MPSHHFMGDKCPNWPPCCATSHLYQPPAESPHHLMPANPTLSDANHPRHMNSLKLKSVPFIWQQLSEDRIFFCFWLPTTLNSLSCPANCSLHMHSLKQPFRELAISHKVTPYQRRRTSVIAGVFGYFHLTAASASAGMTSRHTWYRAIWPRVRHIKQQIKVSFL